MGTGAMRTEVFTARVLRDLLRPRPYPAVSILAPTQRHRPGNPEDPTLLRDLATEACRRLRAEMSARRSNELVQQIEQAVSAVDWNEPGDGLALFVAPAEARLFIVPFPVPAHVAVDETFATRDLVRGVARNPRYRVLALGEKPTRVFEGEGHRLDELRAGGFPCFVEGSRGEPLESGGYTVHSSRGLEQHRTFFRRVDDLVGAMIHSEPSPLVVMGTERDLAFFDEVTEHSDAVVGQIQGNFEDASARKVAELAAPVVERYASSRRVLAIAGLVEAIGSGRAVVGMKPVWETAQAGRARVLLVEDDFVYPARQVDDTLEPAGDDTAPGVMDDAVDELVATVMLGGGEVVVTEPGELAEHGPVAALLRY